MIFTGHFVNMRILNKGMESEIYRQKHILYQFYLFLLLFSIFFGDFVIFVKTFDNHYNKLIILFGSIFIVTLYLTLNSIKH